MWKPRTTLHLALPMLLALGLPGCAFHPVLDEEKEFKASTVEGLPCITTDYSKALKCANTLSSELYEISKGAQEYNLFSSYTAWGLGSVTGGVLAFDGGEDVLKGLAVGVGSLVGLNAVVKPDEQLKIASKAKTELQCLISVAQQIRAAQLDNNVQGITARGNQTLTQMDQQRSAAMAPFMNAAGAGAAPAVSANQLYTLIMYQAQDQQFKALKQATEDLANALGTEQSLAGELSGSVLELRGRVADQLQALSKTNDDAAKDQRDLVVGMAGEIVKKKAELRKQQEATPPSGDTSHQSLMMDARTAVDGTEGIEKAFAKCANPATVEALKI